MRNACLALLLTVAASAQSAPTSYTGEAVVRSINDMRVAVFLDTNGDKVVDQGFLLSTDIPMHGDMSVHFPAARLVFTDGYLRVTSDGTVYDLQVAGYPDPPSAPSGAELVTLIGSALTHSSGDSGCNIERVQAKDPGACYAYGR